MASSTSTPPTVIDLTNTPTPASPSESGQTPTAPYGKGSAQSPWSVVSSPVPPSTLPLPSPRLLRRTLWAEPQDSPHVTPERDDRNSGDESDTSAELNRTAALWTAAKSSGGSFSLPTHTRGDATHDRANADLKCWRGCGRLADADCTAEFQFCAVCCHGTRPSQDPLRHLGDCTYLFHQTLNAQSNFNKRKNMDSLPIAARRYTGRGKQPILLAEVEQHFPRLPTPGVRAIDFDSIDRGSSSRDKYAPPLGFDYPVCEGDDAPGFVNSANNRRTYGVDKPPFRMRAPFRPRGSPPALEELEVMIIDGGVWEGKPFHYVAHSTNCLGYRKNHYFPNIMAPTGKFHGCLMRKNRGSSMGLLADYMYMVHFS